MMGAALEPTKLTVPQAVAFVRGYVPGAKLTVSGGSGAGSFLMWATAPAHDASGAAALPAAVSLPPGATCRVVAAAAAGAAAAASASSSAMLCSAVVSAGCRLLRLPHDRGATSSSSLPAAARARRAYF